MVYGDIYSLISDELLIEISGMKLVFLSPLVKVYFKIFGYPDVAGIGRYPHIIKMLKPKDKEKILDVGCGNGIYANSLAYYFGVQSTGCDLDKKRIKIAQKISDSLKINSKFLSGDIKDINFINQTFDKIICVEVIEHIKDDIQIIKKFNRLLRNKGVLVISTARKEKWGDIQEKEYFEKARKGEHVRSGYEFNKFKKILGKYGFKIVKYDLYYQYFSKLAIKVQQKLYNHNLVFLNLITCPLLTLFSKLDYFLPLNLNKKDGRYWYRGFIVKAVKNE